MSKEKKTPETEVVTNESNPVKTTSLAAVSDNGNMLLMDESRKQSFCSMNPQTFQEKAAFYNAISSPSKRLGDMINLAIELQHVYAETCNYLNKESGELQAGVRIVLIDKDGVSYNTSSIGVYNSLSKIFSIFGVPQSWESPITVRVKQITPADNRKVLTLELVA